MEFDKWLVAWLVNWLVTSLVSQSVSQNAEAHLYLPSLQRCPHQVVVLKNDSTCSAVVVQIKKEVVKK